jgi:hypothetical protein
MIEPIPKRLRNPAVLGNPAKLVVIFHNLTTTYPTWTNLSRRMTDNQHGVMFLIGYGGILTTLSAKSSHALLVGFGCGLRTRKIIDGRRWALTGTDPKAKQAPSPSGIHATDSAS